MTESDGIQYRAVKEIRKCPQSSSAIDYNRELEAIAKFSHPKVRGMLFTLDSSILREAA